MDPKDRRKSIMALYMSNDDQFGGEPLLSDVQKAYYSSSGYDSVDPFYKFEEMKHLDELQVQLAQKLIRIRHPLHDIKLYEALPYLRVFKNFVPRWMRNDQNNYDDHYIASSQSSLDLNNSFSQVQDDLPDIQNEPTNHDLQLQATREEQAKAVAKPILDLFLKQEPSINNEQEVEKTAELLQKKLSFFSNFKQQFKKKYSLDKLIDRHMKNLERDEDAKLEFTAETSNFFEVEAMGHPKQQGDSSNEIIDPFIKYGVGIRNFFRLQERLLWLFLFLSVAAIIQMLIFGQFGGLAFMENESMYTKFSFGNIGFSKAICGRAFFDIDESTNTLLNFQCEGTTQITHVLTAGIMLDELYGGEDQANRACQPKPQYTSTDFSRHFNPNFSQILLDQCQGKQICTGTFTNNDIFAQPLSDSESKLLLTVYAQVACTQTQEDLLSKTLLALIIVSIGLIMVCISRVTFVFMRKVDILDEKLVDMSLVSVNDYTLTAKIPKALFNKYKFQYPNNDKNCSILKKFKNFMIFEIRRFLEEKCFLPWAKTQIVDMQFAFSNAKIIDLLAQRGDALRNADFDKVTSIEQKMTNEKNSNFEQYTTPLSFFCTFKHEAAFLQCMEQEHLEILGFKLRTNRAKQPTNLLWENRGFSKKRKGIYLSLTIVLMFLIGALYYFFQTFFLQAKVTQMILQQPAGINCAEYDNLSPSQYEKQAISQYLILKEDLQKNHYLQALNLMLSREGYFSCFCKSQIAAGIDVSQKNYTLDYFVFGDNTPHQDGGMMCNQFNIATNAQGNYSLLINSYSYFVVFFAYILREVLVWLGSKIGFFNRSSYIKFIMISVFYITLFQYALVPLLAPLDSRVYNSESKLLGITNRFGLYSDLNSGWFEEVGTLICFNMFFSAFWPIIEFIYMGLTRALFRILDQRNPCFSNKPKSTRVKTILGFEQLYSGPVFFIHWKYSFMLNAVFVAFIFGPALPILFPISFLNLFILYTVERLMLAYSYQKPPEYDASINKVTLGMLNFAPILYALSGAWVFSNQQVFRNTVNPNQLNFLYPDADHSFEQFFYQLTPGTIFFGIFILLFLMMLIWPGVNPLACISDFSGNTIFQKDAISQNLKNFYSVLTSRHRKMWIREEIVCGERLDLQRMKKKTFEKLILKQEEDQRDQKFNKLQGAHNYDILANPHYNDMFAYVPCRFPMRCQYAISPYSDKELRKISFDLVRLVIDLPYLPEKRAKALEFSPKYIYEERKEINANKRINEIVNQLKQSLLNRLNKPQS